MGNNKAIKLVEELLKTIDSIGLDKTINTLSVAQSHLADENIIVQEFIISSTCSVFSMDKKGLHSGKSSKNKTNAIALTSYLLNSTIGLSQTDISILLRKDNSVISKYIKRISNLDKNHIADRELILILQKLDLLIKEFKTKIIN